MIIIPKHVEVTDNGVIFYSNRRPLCGIHSYIEGEDIKLEQTFYTGEQKNSKVLKVVIALVLLVFAFTLRNLCSVNILGTTVVFLLYCYSNFFSLCEDFFYSHISKKKRRHQQLHVAKNMLFNSYQKLDGIPNLWEIEGNDEELYKKTLHTLAGLLFSVSFIFYKYDNPFQLFGFFIVVTTIVEIIVRIVHKLRILVYLQWLFRAEPTDIELQCVLDGFCKWLQIEKDFLFM